MDLLVARTRSLREVGAALPAQFSDAVALSLKEAGGSELEGKVSACMLEPFILAVEMDSKGDAAEEALQGLSLVLRGSSIDLQLRSLTVSRLSALIRTVEESVALRLVSVLQAGILHTDGRSCLVHGEHLLSALRALGTAVLLDTHGSVRSAGTAAMGQMVGAVFASLEKSLCSERSSENCPSLVDVAFCHSIVSDIVNTSVGNPSSGSDGTHPSPGDMSGMQVCVCASR